MIVNAEKAADDGNSAAIIFGASAWVFRLTSELNGRNMFITLIDLVMFRSHRKGEGE